MPKLEQLTFRSFRLPCSSRLGAVALPPVGARLHFHARGRCLNARLPSHREPGILSHWLALSYDIQISFRRFNSPARQVAAVSESPRAFASIHLSFVVGGGQRGAIVHQDAGVDGTSSYVCRVHSPLRTGLESSRPGYHALLPHLSRHWLASRNGGGEPALQPTCQ